MIVNDLLYIHIHIHTWPVLTNYENGPLVKAWAK